MGQFNATPSQQQNFNQHIDKLVELADHLGIDIFVTISNPTEENPNRCTSWGCYNDELSASVFNQLKAVVDSKDKLK